MLANIYLHELDCYVGKLIAVSKKGKERSRTPEYMRTTLRASRLNKMIEQENDPEVRGKLLDQKKVLQRHTLEIPSRDQHDPTLRRLKYGRYADDFVLGAICPKSEAEEIYRKIETFLQEERNLKTSPAKSGLKHNTEIIRFLGYDITIQNTDRVVKLIIKGQHGKQRTLKAQITLKVPEAKMKSFAEKNRYGSWETGQAIHRPLLMQIRAVEMASLYSAEMRGFAQYYARADNFSSLSRLRFLWWQSFLKTMGSKHKTSMQQVATMLNRGSYMAVRVRTEKGRTREVKLFRLKEVKREALFDNDVDNPPLTFKYTSGSELSKRMDANKCAYCEREGGYFEIHHVRKLADMKEGKQPWQKLMIARKRKTLVLCVDCHHRLTAGKLPDRRHLLK
jgi:AI2M/AI1M-like, HNH endonuclease/Type II intron maturase